MSRETVTVTHEGWFLFCPIWLADADSDTPSPIPKAGLWWLLDLATFVAVVVNWLIALVAPDACGFALKVRPLRKPLAIVVETIDESPKDTP